MRGKRAATSLVMLIPGLLAVSGVVGFCLSAAMIAQAGTVEGRASPVLSDQAGGPGPGEAASNAGSSRETPTPADPFKILQTYPHDPAAFTQGLVFAKGVLFESTGIRGRSSVRKVQLETGRVFQSRSLDSAHFGEGLTLWEDRVIQLTWQSGVAFLWNRETLSPDGEFRYEGEGWGITHDGRFLIMSDGTATLRFLDPASFQVVRSIEVLDQGAPVPKLNELEYIRGAIYANIWGQDRIARISPETGEVLSWVDLSSLRNAMGPVQGLDALNGIAWDPDGDRIFVTGKLWPRVFEIRLLP